MECDSKGKKPKKCPSCGALTVNSSDGLTAGEVICLVILIVFPGGFLIQSGFAIYCYCKKWRTKGNQALIGAGVTLVLILFMAFVSSR